MAGAILVASALLGVLVFRPAGAAGRKAVTAARDIPAGHAVTSSDLRVAEVRVPDETAVVRDPGDATGRVAVHHIAAGDLVSPSDLADGGPARREVSVPVGADHVPSGRIQPGDHVDVLATYTDGTSSRTSVVARTVEVVAVTSQQALIGGGDAGALSAVTVACDPHTAAVLVFAARTAKVDVVKAVGGEGAEMPTVGVSDLAGVTDTVRAASS